MERATGTGSSALLLLGSLLAGGVLASGCRVDAEYSAVGFACSAEEPCGPGADCVSGVCQAEGPIVDASPDVDAPGDEADATAIDCLPAVVLADTFESGALDPQWTADADTGTSVTVAEGLLTLTPTTANPIRFARVESALLDFEERRLFLEVPTMVATDTQAIGELLLKEADGDFYFLRQSQGVLQLGSVIDGSELIAEAGSYDGDGHRYWQFRLTGGSVYADLSEDGENWENFGALPRDMTGPLLVNIGAGTRNSVSEPGTMQVDNVNSGSGLCP